jgi:GTP pyrophosphokinase
LNKISFQYNKERFSDEENALINKAFEFAVHAHGDQQRDSGDPYIIHPISVAERVADWGLDYRSVQAALLHDVVEDTDVSLKEIERAFDNKVAELVDGVTKLNMSSMPNLSPNSTRAEVSIENLRKLLLASSNDPRVLMIKLADRLHNLSTLQFVSPERQHRIARESLEVFAPLADRLGMGRVKGEIEDMSFRYFKPKEYAVITRQLKSLFKDTEKQLIIMRREIGELLKKGDIYVLSVEGRQKHVYSVYKKMAKSGGDISKMHDLLAIRVIVPTEADCYHAMGLIHQVYKPLIYLIKDYIAVPKPNGYRSLHTTVFGHGGRIIEIQIRTQQMHEEAEFGVAAHYHYDAHKNTPEYAKGKAAKAVVPEESSWVRHLARMRRVAVSGQEFSEGNDVDLFAEDIFVFSPKGDLYDLPEGATPIDFAFGVHTDIGLRAMGAKVNGRMVNLDSKLENRDVVEIITRREPAPNRDWLNFVKTSVARNAIRGWFRSISRESNIISGRIALETELKAWHTNRVEDIPQRRLTAALESMRMRSVDDLLAAIGDGSITVGQVAKRLFPDLAKPKAVPVVKRLEPTGHVLVEGEQLPYTLAPCCHPVYPQTLMGYVTRGAGVTVHALGCKNIPTETERLVQCRWETDAAGPEMLVCKLSVDAHNRVAMLSDITGLIAGRGLHIGQISSQPVAGFDRSTVKFSLEVTDLFELADIMRQLERIPGVIQVERL